ncbi:MAG: hypothetical protein HYW26_05300 [Candidatus Aenigmarchaeota archaeon]|nr:hypothetical protein [Candidatus Aenigmarchaeota archaeon]
MINESAIKQTRSYIETKYDVDLSGIELKFIGSPVYGPKTGKPYYTHYDPETETIYIFGHDVGVITGSIALSTALGILSYTAIGKISIIPASCIGLYGIVMYLSGRPALTHEYMHAASDMIVGIDNILPSFLEALPIHEEFSNPHLSRPERISTAMHHFLYRKHMPDLTYWSEVFDWMDGKDRERRIDRLRQRLDALEIPHAEEFCDALYRMRPRQFVEEHGLLDGFRRFLGDRDSNHLWDARDKFYLGGGNLKSSEKYIALARRKVY